MYAGVPMAELVIVAARVERLGDAEVDDAGAVGADQDVLRLEVAVHDAGLVDGDQRGHRADGQAFEVGAGARRLVETLLGAATGPGRTR